eukprot:13107216-Ditylum_brightwellii.AAC.1
MASNLNFYDIGTCKANRKGFGSDTLMLEDPEKGDYVHLVDDRVMIVIIQWKSSKEYTSVRCSNGIALYE